MTGHASSILAVDIGSATTRAILVDLVDGTYQIVGRTQVRTTAGFPVGDVGQGVGQAAALLAEMTGRQLIDEDGQLISPETPDRRGVDVVVTTTSAGRPLRVALIGLVGGVSIASARRALGGTYVEVVEELSLDDPRSEDDQLNALMRALPDVLMIVGGTEGGARAPLQRLLGTSALAVRLLPAALRPAVLYAGNSAATADVQARLGALTRVLVAPNVRPALDREDLAAATRALAAAFDAVKAQQGGFLQVASLGRGGLLPSAQSYALVAAYLARRGQRANVLLLDVGSSASTLATCIDGEALVTIATDLGVGVGAASLLEAVGPEAVQAYLPFTFSAHQLRNAAYDKALRPTSVPGTPQALFLEHAFLRAATATLLDRQRPAWPTPRPHFDTVVGAGGPFTNTGTPAFDALLLLDAAQPTGLVQLYADPDGLLAALGAIAPVVPEAVVHLMDGGGLAPLGSALCADRVPRLGRAAAMVEVRLDDGVVLRERVPSGGVHVVPLPPGQTAELRVRGLNGTRFGRAGAFRGRVSGGEAGIVVDLRGRPLAAAAGHSVNARARTIPSWVAQVTGVTAWDVPSELLRAAADADAAPVAPPRRRVARASAQTAPDDATPQKDEIDELRDLFS